MSARHAAGAAAAAIGGLLLIGGPAIASTVEVQIHLPMPQKIDVTGMRRLLVGGFRVNDDPSLDIDVEYRKTLEDLLKRRTTFEVLEVDPPPLPEQELNEVVKNTSYWRRIAQRFAADLIVAGAVKFERTDKSGFVSEDVINPLNGQRIRRTRYTEREGFDLAVTLYFFGGATGDLLYEQRLTEEAIYEGRGNDGLTALHQLADRSSGDVIGVLMPREKVETRHLIVE